MKTVLRQVLKKLSDASIRSLGYLLPKWPAQPKGPVVLPQVTRYALPMPLNAAQLPAAYRAQFGEKLSLPERRVHLVHHAQVSWHGVVFRNLRLFRPSVSPLVTLEAEFSGGFLLRQWAGSTHVVVFPDELIGLAHGPWAVGNYYHWLIDTLPRLLLLQQQYPDCRLLVPEPLPAYARQTAAIFGFERLLPLPYGTVATVPRLAMPDYAAVSGYQDAAMSRAVREAVLQAFHLHGAGGGRRVYVSRSRQRMRRLVNEAAIAQLLRHYGFETVFFEEMTFEEQVRTMHETSVLLGVHGANLANMLFMSSSTTVVELMYLNQNQRIFNPCYYHLAFALELGYYNVPCRSAVPTPAVETNDVDLVVDPAALQQVFSTLFDSH